MKTEMTSLAWWTEVKTSRALLEGWLYDQYRGEVSASGRIVLLRDAFASPGSRAHRVLSLIAEQEEKHARWVGDLLRARGLAVRVEPVPERYWALTVPEVTDLETGAALGAHAEKMRLERIEVIASDPAAEPDLRDVFQRILPEERFHERAFRTLASPSALARMQDAHALGRGALGLTR